MDIKCNLHLIPNYTYDGYLQVNYPSKSSKNIRIPMDLKLQEEDAMWHINSSLCGPHNIHVSPFSIAISIFTFIYLIISIIKYLSHSNVLKSFIFSFIKIPNVSIQPRELVRLMELSCYAII